jgi:hypothetical protein
MLSEVTTSLLSGTLIVDETLPLVVSGRAPWRSEVESDGVTVSLRAIPLKSSGDRVGALVLSRDVTVLRRQERELITKDATIREIHHRVKKQTCKPWRLCSGFNPGAQGMRKPRMR